MLGWEKKQPALERKASRSGVPVTSAAAFLRAQEDLIDAPTLYEAQALRYSRSDLVYMCVNRIAEMCAGVPPRRCAWPFASVVSYLQPDTWLT